MARPPKVSVNVVTYNQEAFLAETLDSILAQNYPNLEIVITDDASKDGTPAIMKAYHEKFPTIIKLLFATTNGGIAANANRGMAACTGKYLCPFAGDDLFLPGKLEAQVALMEANPDCTMSYHNVEWFESSTGKTIRNHFEPGRAPYPTEDNLKLFAYNPIPGPGVMLLTSALPTVPNHPEYPFSSDWILWLTLASQGTLRYLNGTYVRYRRHSQNETLVNPRIGTEQLRSIQFIKKQFPQAPAKAIRHAEALSWQADAIGQIGQGRFFKAVVSFVKAIQYGRITMKNLAAMAVCIAAGFLPKPLRLNLARRMSARRFS